MITWLGHIVTLRQADADSNAVELCILDSAGEPAAKIATLTADGKLVLAENIHPDVAIGVALDFSDRIVVE